MKQLSYKVFGLDCAEEIAVLKKVVGSHEAIGELTFDVLNAKMTVSYDGSKIDSSGILDLIASTGMRAVPWEDRSKETRSFWQINGRAILTTISGVFLFVGLFVHYLYHPSLVDIFGGATESHHTPIPAIILYTCAMLTGGYYIFPKAYSALKRIRPDMNLLMIIAVLGSIAIREWFEGATVTFLFSVATFLEHWSVNRARRAVSALMDLSPTLAKVIDPKSLEAQEKHVEDVPIGSMILVRPGEKVPLDGVVKKGSSSINQAPITGESIPVSKHEGDPVFAGTINEDGALEIETSKGSDDTTIARIIHLVQEAGSRRASSEQWVETFAKYYTPIMLLVAVLICVVPPLFFSEPWMEWVYRSLVILVIACPCALVISTPVSIVSGLTASARNGVLIKGGMFLELVSRLKAIAMDKTGTLTYGKPEVQKIIALSGHSETELLEIAAALESSSEHPLARAIIKRAKDQNLKQRRADNFTVVKGKGAEALLDGKQYWIGSHRFMHEKGQETDEIHAQCEELEDEGHSIVAIGNEDHICGLISIADQPREMIKEIVFAMKAENIKRVVMLTGDNTPTAKALAALTGVDEFYAELLPEDKVSNIERLVEEDKYVAMVGDGVNDAPAMAVSTMGIAMGAMGTDAAIETADIALMTDDLAKVPWLIRHSRRVLRIIKENIFFSLTVKFAFLILALFGLATLWMAILADTGAALLVVFNGLRSLRTRTSGIENL